MSKFFVFNAAICSEQQAVPTSFDHVTKYDGVSLNEIFSVVVKEERLRKWEETYTRKNLDCHGKLGVWTAESVQDHQNCEKSIRENFPCRRSFAAQQLLEETKNGKKFVYGQCDHKVPKNLRDNLANFSPIFKNTSINKNGIGDFVRNEKKIVSRSMEYCINPGKCWFQA